jgi:hypothetical protein
LPGLDTALNRLLAAWQGEASAAAVQAEALGLELRGDPVLVTRTMHDEAAVVWSANRCLAPRQIGALFQQRALDDGAPGYDVQYGSGVLHLGAPTRALCTPVTPVYRTYLPHLTRGGP